MPPGVLCDVACDLQRCMAPLMCLEGDEIVEASLLGPTDDESRMCPTPEEEALLLGDEPEPQEAKQATMFPCEHPGETPKSKEPVKQSDTMPTSTSAIATGSSGNPSQNTRRTQIH